jgi:hypothetical protein
MPRAAGMSRWLAVAPIPLMLATAAHAASNGSLGATSRGSVVITASIAARASVTGAADVRFGSPSAAPTAEPQALCVASNSRLHRFEVEAVGSGPGGAFELRNGSDVMRYSVNWSFPELSVDSRTTLLAAASSVGTQPCGTARGLGTFEIELHREDLASSKSLLAYTGALTLLLTPE